MANLELSFASQDYDHTRALADGRVRVEGAAIRHIDLFPAYTFQRMLGKREFDMCEMALTLYLSTLDKPDPPFIAIPVFPARSFRHSAIFVRTNGRVREPRDLIGKRVGEFYFYGHDAGTWAKGILADEYGVRHDAYSYAIGGVVRRFGPQDWLPAQPPPHIKVEHIGPDRTLDEMLGRGELDAVIAPHPPAALVRGDGTVRRLFEDYETVERQWYAKTRIFPIMHTLVVRREIYDRNRAIARSLYDGFKAAKQLALERYHEGAGRFTMPWMMAHAEGVRRLMGPDWWPYGVAANRTTLETFARYHHEQGMSRRRIAVEEMFVPETLGD